MADKHHKKKWNPKGPWGQGPETEGGWLLHQKLKLSEMFAMENTCTVCKRVTHHSLQGGNIHSREMNICVDMESGPEYGSFFSKKYDELHTYDECIQYSIVCPNCGHKRILGCEPMERKTLTVVGVRNPYD
jgi:DNA-directed RNA polymerase subunit RPC12/RpoP